MYGINNTGEKIAIDTIPILSAVEKNQSIRKMNDSYTQIYAHNRQWATQSNASKL